jgi:hypothetical protein
MRAHLCPCRSLLVAAVTVALCFSAVAQTSIPLNRSVRSFSGQFIVTGASKGVLAGRQPDFARDGKHLVLQPALMAVSCERIKQALDNELNDHSQWRSKIFVTLFSAETADDEIGFLAERFKDGWSYRLEIPTPVERTRLVRAMTQAILTEHANRQAGERSAEIPLWLVEGFTQQLLSDHGAEVLLSPPESAVNLVPISRSVVTNDVAKVWRRLGDKGPMSLEELSWPKDNQLSGPEAAGYGESARLFIKELLQFQDGQVCLRETLEQLPNFQNWQMAFLCGFKPHFSRQLDVEKWWALQANYFNDRDVHGLWSAEESWAKVEAILIAPIETRRDKEDLPATSEVPLTTVIKDWNFERQSQTLTEKLTELNGARDRVSLEFVPLVDSYRRALSDYLSIRKKSPARIKAASQQLLKLFELFELERQKLKPKNAAPIASRTADTAEIPKK